MRDALQENRAKVLGRTRNPICNLLWRKKGTCFHFERREELGEGAKPGPNFHDVVARLDIELRDNPTGEVLVVEKVLSEAPGGCGLELPEKALDFAQCHISY